MDRELTRAVPLSIAPRRLWYFMESKMHIKTSGEGNFVIITKNVPRKFSWPRVITLSFLSQNNSRFRSLFLNEKFVAKNADWNRWKSKVQLMWVPITCLFVSLVSKKAPLATTGSLLSLCLCTHDLLFDNKAYKWMNSSRLSIHQKERPQKASFPKHICLACMYIRLVQHLL